LGRSRGANLVAFRSGGLSSLRRGDPVRSAQDTQAVFARTPAEGKSLGSELPSTRKFGGPRAGVSRHSGPFSCPYSPECVEYEFSEVRIHDPEYPSVSGRGIAHSATLIRLIHQSTCNTNGWIYTILYRDWSILLYSSLITAASTPLSSAECRLTSQRRGICLYSVIFNDYLLAAFLSPEPAERDDVAR
jgi:hypothetical protein